MQRTTKTFGLAEQFKSKTDLSRELLLEMACAFKAIVSCSIYYSFEIHPNTLSSNTISYLLFILFLFLSLQEQCDYIW